MTLLAWNTYIKADLRSAIEVTHLRRGKSISKTQIRKSGKKKQKLELSRSWHFKNNQKMISTVVLTYVTSTFNLICEWKHGRIPVAPLFAPRWWCPQSSGTKQRVRLHLRASPRSKFSASIRRQWEGGTTGRRPLSASLGSAGPLTRHIWDMSSRGSGTVSLSGWRFRAQLQEACISAWTQRVR